MCFSCLVIFLFKLKTAYEMRISDWSSDVCSSDLTDHYHPFACQRLMQQGLVDALDPCHQPGVLLLLGLEDHRGQYRDPSQAQQHRAGHREGDGARHRLEHLSFEAFHREQRQEHHAELGRATCREKMSTYV